MYKYFTGIKIDWENLMSATAQPTKVCKPLNNVIILGDNWVEEIFEKTQ